jgi:hypothetical protein
MTAGSRSFLRENAFLVAAVALPGLVVVFFLLATAIPRWTVPPPAYDLVVRAPRPFDGARRRLAVELNVRDGRIEATVRGLGSDAFSQIPVLFLYDHRTSTVREIPIPLPETMAADETRTIAVDAAPGRRVVAEVRAPDGYALEARNSNGTGIVGEVFGMRRYDSGMALVNRGRVIPLALPPPYEAQYGVSSVGWIVDDGAH